MSTPSPREKELERRRAALEPNIEIIEGSAEPVAPRKLDQMVSLRLDPDVLAELRTIAEGVGKSVSDCIRDAVAQWIRCMDMSTVKIDFLKIETGMSSHFDLPEMLGPMATFSNFEAREESDSDRHRSTRDALA